MNKIAMDQLAQHRLCSWLHRGPGSQSAALIGDRPFVTTFNRLGWSGLSPAFAGDGGMAESLKQEVQRS